jgi:hypothetical protein
MFYCGSGFDFCKVLVPVPNPDNILHSFPTTENFLQYLAFSMSEAVAVFYQKVITFHVGSGGRILQYFSLLPYCIRVGTSTPW